MITLEKILDEIHELRQLIEMPAEKPDDLVDAAYVAHRTGLAERTVIDGKAGTNAIPRVRLKAKNAKKSLVRFPRGAVDRFVADLARSATTPKQRALELVASVRTQKGRRR